MKSQALPADYRPSSQDDMPDQMIDAVNYLLDIFRALDAPAVAIPLWQIQSEYCSRCRDDGIEPGSYQASDLMLIFRRAGWHIYCNNAGGSFDYIFSRHQSKLSMAYDMEEYGTLTP